jgi:hypothetical protein
VPLARNAHDDDVVFDLIAPEHSTVATPRVPVFTANVA